MEIILVAVGALVLFAILGFTHHSRKGQSTVGAHPVNSEAAPVGATGPSEVDRDRGEYPMHDRGTGT